MRLERPSLIKLINHIYRNTQSYTDRALKKFELSSGTYPYLLVLHHNEGISQNEISRVLDVDKAMSTRTIKKLIEHGYIKRIGNPEDYRANKLYLTDNAKLIIPKIKEEIDKWVDVITSGINIDERDIVVGVLGKILNNAKNVMVSDEESEG